MLLSTCPSTASSARLVIPNHSVLPAITNSQFTTTLLRVATILCLSLLLAFHRDWKPATQQSTKCQNWQRACRQALLLQLWWQVSQCAPKALFREGDPASLLWGSKHNHKTISYAFDSSFACSGNLLYSHVYLSIEKNVGVYMCVSMYVYVYIQMDVYMCVYIHTRAQLQI